MERSSGIISGISHNFNTSPHIRKKRRCYSNNKKKQKNHHSCHIWMVYNLYFYHCRVHFIDYILYKYRGARLGYGVFITTMFSKKCSLASNVKNKLKRPSVRNAGVTLCTTKKGSRVLQKRGDINAFFWF